MPNIQATRQTITYAIATVEAAKGLVMFCKEKLQLDEDDLQVMRDGWRDGMRATLYGEASLTPD